MIARFSASAKTVAASNDAFKVFFVELRHLKAFVTVAEERHFGRAAERLGISQPPLSRQIQQLEATLGIKLFSRSSRSVTLTKEGAEYLDAIRPHLRGLEQAADAALLSTRKLSGKVRAGFVSTLAYGTMPLLLESLKKTAPGIAVELSEMPSPEQVLALRENRMDIGFVIMPVEDLGLKLRQLFREPVVAMMRTNHAAAARPSVPLNELAKETFVMCPRYRQTGFHETIRNLCRSVGFEPQVIHESSSIASTMELVAAGLGVSLVPESAMLNDHSGVVYKQLAGGPLMLDIAAVWLEDAMNSTLRAFLDQAIEVTAQRRNKPARSLRMGQVYG